MKKNERQILKTNNSVESDEYKKLIVLIVIIATVFLVFYLATSIFTKQDNDDIFDNDLNATEIQYDEIIIGNMFNKSGEYYVLLLEEDDPYSELFESYVTTIKPNHKIYTVDLSNAFNKSYVTDEYSYDSENFKTKGNLLVKIKDGKIKEHYELEESILEKLEELTKSAE
ncbi:MAG: hypothetical protein E7157_05040 [Lactobacillales bacterium]|nr:hypothetical protein [Lactobacillales bacterium]